jgi:hypothetical protein
MVKNNKILLKHKDFFKDVQTMYELVVARTWFVSLSQRPFKFSDRQCYNWDTILGILLSKLSHFMFLAINLTDQKRIFEITAPIWQDHPMINAAMFELIRYQLFEDTPTNKYTWYLLGEFYIEAVEKRLNSDDLETYQKSRVQRELLLILDKSDKYWLYFRDVISALCYDVQDIYYILLCETGKILINTSINSFSGIPYRSCSEPKNVGLRLLDSDMHYNTWTPETTVSVNTKGSNIDVLINECYFEYTQFLFMLKNMLHKCMAVVRYKNKTELGRDMFGFSVANTYTQIRHLIDIVSTLMISSIKRCVKDVFPYVFPTLNNFWYIIENNEVLSVLWAEEFLLFTNLNIKKNNLYSYNTDDEVNYIEYMDDLVILSPDIAYYRVLLLPFPEILRFLRTKYLELGESILDNNDKSFWDKKW